MKRAICTVAAITLLLSGCGKREEPGAALRRYYETLTGATMTAEVVCHLPEESRTFTISCICNGDGGAEVTVIAPAELAGLTASVSEDGLTLGYDGLSLAAGRLESLSPANCLPWLLRAAASGYVLEEGRETLEDAECLRLTFDTTTPQGEKVLCTVWFDADSLAPRYGEFTMADELILSARIQTFAAETAREGSTEDGIDTEENLGGD